MKISNKIDKHRSGSRGSTPSRKKIHLKPGKRRPKSVSEEDSDEGKAKKKKEGEL